MQNRVVLILIVLFLSSCKNGSKQDNTELRSNMPTDTIRNYNAPKNEETKTKKYSTKQEEINDTSSSITHYMPEKSKIINPTYSTDLLFNYWAHNSNDATPAFKIDETGFHVKTNEGYHTIPYILKQDTLEIFEYHGGPHGSETSKGIITKLNKDSLVISYYTGGESTGRYVKFKMNK